VNTPGALHTPARRMQICDYSGLRFGTITPTDIDGFIDLHGKAFIIFELKHRGAELPRGQRIALESLVKGRPGIVFVAEHSVDDVKQSVNAADCLVRELYLPCARLWRKPKCKITLLEAIQSYIESLEESEGT